MFLRLNNSKGQGLLAAIMVGAGVASIGGFILVQSQQTEMGLRAPRVRSAMIGKEAQLRLLMNQSSSFSCPTGVHSCTLSPVVQGLLAIEEIIPGARCPTGTSTCGIRVQNPALVGTHFTATIDYAGQEISVMEVGVNIDIPLEALQAAQYECNSATPRFVGYKPDGTLNCQALPANCGSGEFIVKIDPQTLALTCGRLEDEVGCKSGYYMSSFRWTGKNSYIECLPRLDPFAYFSFAPILNVSVTAVGTPSTAPADTCGVPTPTSSTTTTTLAPMVTTTSSTTTTILPAAVTPATCSSLVAITSFPFNIPVRTGSITPCYYTKLFNALGPTGSGGTRASHILARDHEIATYGGSIHPFVLGTTSREFKLLGPRNLVLSGNALWLSLAAISMDNFLLIGQRPANSNFSTNQYSAFGTSDSPLIGADYVTVFGNPVPVQTSSFSGTSTLNALTLTSQYPVNQSQILDFEALDCGSSAWLSDIYLIFQ